MRRYRYLSLLPLLLIVLSGAEAQSFCNPLSGAAWTRCYDFTASSHGFTPHVSNGSRGSWPGGQHVPGTGFVALPYPGHPNNGTVWRKWVRIQTPSAWPSTSITQVKLIYQLTPGISDETVDWAGTIGQSGSVSWSRADLVSGAGTVSASGVITHSGNFGYFWAQASRCNSGCTSGTVDGSMTLIAIVLGGDGAPLPGGVDPSTGGGSPGLDVGVTPVFDAMSTYLPTLFLMFAAPAAVFLAAVLVSLIVYAVFSAIKSASGR